jgi:hypothetical protein
MAFLEDIGKKITQTGQDAVTKTKNVAETMKLNGLITEEERTADSYLLQLGRAYYDRYADNPDPVFSRIIDAVRESREKSGAYAEQLKQIKGVATCPKCGGDVPSGAAFCNNCGQKIG